MIKDNTVNTEIGNCLVLWTSTPRSSSTFLAHHKTQFLAFIDHSKSTPSTIPLLTILTQLSFSPHLEISKMALKALCHRGENDPRLLHFLRAHKLPSTSTGSSLELVPFVGRLCGRLDEYVTKMTSPFTESSPSDGKIYTLSAPLPDESPLLTGNAVLEILRGGFTLLNSLLSCSDHTFHNILIDCDFVHLLKSTIITCLDLLEQPKSESNCTSVSDTDLLIDILDSSWNSVSSCLWDFDNTLHHVIQRVFSDIPQLCTLFERTCCHSSPTHSSHLSVIINITEFLPHWIPRMLEENLVERMIDQSKLISAPITDGHFHELLVWAVLNLLMNPKNSIKSKEKPKRRRMLRFERVLKPAKQYLQFILPREEFIRKENRHQQDFSTRVTDLFGQILMLERDLFKDGVIVETGREEWEVGWLVEKTDERVLAQRLRMIRGKDEEMKKNEKGRWKKRVERQREAGFEDAVEERLMRRDTRQRSEIVKYIKRVGMESGMNIQFFVG
ncbi:hypothetical protein BLNAU_16558 [Blattamonas nauphoetae]|uniref:Uncharacterized protein n=1 Tax=Blattamonas nauphoetae TaxID=2049346 RepID=A0ABQ9XCA4_9EUKA|nr:hypothetical protein BLNAU_16558 [Blattamonas nauphoetae]